MNFSAPEMNFTAELAPLYDAEGYEIPTHLGQRTIRSDTGDTLSIVGPRYVPVQNTAVLEPFLDDLVDRGYEVHERNPDRSSLYDLAGHKGAFVTTRFAKNGCVMRSDIILGDFVKPTGNTAYLDKGPDTNLFKISVLNSHDGSLASRAITSYERLICMNGVVSSRFAVSAYGKHTTNFDPKTMLDGVTRAFDHMSDDADQFGRWATKRVTSDQAVEAMKHSIAALKPTATNPAPFNAKLLDKLAHNFTSEDQTAWGLLNAVTAWSTHGERRGEEVTTRLARESKVAGFMKSIQWKTLIDA